MHEQQVRGTQPPSVGPMRAALTHVLALLDALGAKCWKISACCSKKDILFLARSACVAAWAQLSGKYFRIMQPSAPMRSHGTPLAATPRLLLCIHPTSPRSAASFCCRICSSSSFFLCACCLSRSFSARAIAAFEGDASRSSSSCHAYNPTVGICAS